RCPLYPQKRTWISRAVMSAFVPKADVRPASFDHLVGEREELCWNFKPKGLCSLEIEGEHEFGWLLHRKIGGLRAFEKSDPNRHRQVDNCPRDCCHNSSGRQPKRTREPRKSPESHGIPSRPLAVLVGQIGMGRDPPEGHSCAAGP